ncbi:MAG: T9SS type A sorting domain-containing protein [Candidatus Delongbacteria bacterium]|nr:T9SS type A sorting domain-containing protein [Candidatus Delongbacteria bacterium]
MIQRCTIFFAIILMIFVSVLQAQIEYKRIYDDTLGSGVTLANGWQCVFDPACTQDPYQGNFCIAFTNWGGWEDVSFVFDSLLDLTDLRYLEDTISFAMKATTKVGLPLIMLSDDDTDGEGADDWAFNIYDATSGWAQTCNWVPDGQWHQIKIPLMDLPDSASKWTSAGTYAGPADYSRITRLALMSQSDNNYEDSDTLWLDDIRIGPAPAGVVDVAEPSRIAPKQPISMLKNYPNPFNPSTTIEFELSQSAQVSLSVYNLAGQCVSKEIDNILMESGIHHVQISMPTLTSGIYFYRLTVDHHHSISGRMVLLK